MTIRPTPIFTDCPDKTYGHGCQKCSDKCRESDCLKTSTKAHCLNGCIAGYNGSDCSSGM